MFQLDQYDFVFFDFDGLLVNTEQLHFQAYQEMCLNRGFALPWSFLEYCSIAHVSSEGLRNEIYKIFPGLYAKEPNWSILYEEKKQAYKGLLDEGNVQLMPGVEQMLLFLETIKVSSCVVTNSFKSQIDQIRLQIPLLQKIPYWITREDYKTPKPSPESYLVAKARYTKEGDVLVGFEDTVRGSKALALAGVKSVVISSCLDEKMQKQLEGVAQFTSFTELLSSL